MKHAPFWNEAASHHALRIFIGTAAIGFLMRHANDAFNPLWAVISLIVMS